MSAVAPLQHTASFATIDSNLHSMPDTVWYFHSGAELYYQYYSVFSRLQSSNDTLLAILHRKMPNATATGCIQLFCLTSFFRFKGQHIFSNIIDGQNICIALKLICYLLWTKHKQALHHSFIALGDTFAVLWAPHPVHVQIKVKVLVMENLRFRTTSTLNWTFQGLIIFSATSAAALYQFFPSGNLRDPTSGRCARFCEAPRSVLQENSYRHSMIIFHLPLRSIVLPLIVLFR